MMFDYVTLFICFLRDDNTVYVFCMLCTYLWFLISDMHFVHWFCYFLGDLPLCNEARKRLRRIKGRVIEILDTSYKLLAYLYQEHVIGEIDYHNLRNESEMTNRNAMLMDIIMRGSERGFACFCDSLSSDVNQAYLVPCLQRGIQLTLYISYFQHTLCKL